MFAAAFTKRHPNVGARPGTLVIPDEAPAPRIRVIRYGVGSVDDKQVESGDLDQLVEAINSESVTWIDVQGFGDQDVIRKIGSVFHLHPLLLEDIVNAPQRPKTESYDDQLLMIVRMVRLDGVNRVDMEQVSVVLGKNYLLTFQERCGDVFDPVRKRIQNPKGNFRKHAADYLAYALIDTVVDGYYPVLETIGDQLEALETNVITNPTPQLLGQLNHFKNRLVNLRRCI